MRRKKSDHQLVLYTIDTLKKEKKEVYVGSEKMVRDVVSGGGWSQGTSFCREQPDKFLVFNDSNLHRIYDNGKIELVSKVDFSLMMRCRILSVENGDVNIFGSECFREIDIAKRRTPSLGVVLGYRPYLMQINLETKEATQESFCDPIEQGTTIISNGNRLMARWNHYDNKFRYLVLDRENQNERTERTIVEVPQEGYKKMTFSEMTPDGRYGICMLAFSDSTIDVFHKAMYQRTTWDAIGIIALP